MKLFALAVVAACGMTTTLAISQNQTFLHRCGNEYVNLDKWQGMQRGCALVSDQPLEVTPGSPAPAPVPPAVSVPPSNWTSIAFGRDLRVFIDLSTVRPQGRYLKAWTLWSYAKAQQSIYGKPYLSGKDMSYYDCMAGTVGVKSTIFYDDAIGVGATVTGGANIDEQRVSFEDVVPQSVGDTVFRAVCSLHKGKTG